MKIAIIIPAYNEADTIGQVIQSVQQVLPESTVVVIDDGSADNTYEKAKEVGAIAIKLVVNLGIGGAVQTGYLYAFQNDFDYAIQVDGDGQHDPEYLTRILAPLIEGKADLVIGSRYINKIGFQSTVMRRIGSRYFNSLIHWITGQKITDPTSGFRACNKRIIKEFALSYPKDYPEPESIVYLKRKGYIIQEIPVTMKERLAGSSSIHHYRSIYYMVKVSTAIMIEAFRKSENRKGTMNYDDGA
ncbi:MAG: glycosyl transferase family 2 [Gracilibacter sp. BRH_c7a]|nr:MAG: glycosyl transferase family 2 [Gracilibacter sp. BRH_c7a]